MNTNILQKWSGRNWCDIYNCPVPPERCEVHTYLATINTFHFNLYDFLRSFHINPSTFLGIHYLPLRSDGCFEASCESAIHFGPTQNTPISLDKMTFPPPLSTFYIYNIQLTYTGVTYGSQHWVSQAKSTLTPSRSCFGMQYRLAYTNAAAEIATLRDPGRGEMIEWYPPTSREGGLVFVYIRQKI